MDIEFVVDGGAYVTLTPVVLSRGTIHAAGPYCCNNIRVRSTAVATNTPPHGAFRGFGAPQSLFAIERHMNEVARAVGLAPEELRRRNFLRPGNTTATRQEIRENLDLTKLQNRALELAHYHQKIDKFKELNRTTTTRKKGIGFSTFLHGAGFTGSGERTLRSVVDVEATSAGTIRILSSMTEMGQGTNTILSQVAAETLGIPYDQVEICRPDTASVPNSGPTVASRTAMIIGKLVERAALKLRDKLVESGLLPPDYSPDQFFAACSRYLVTVGPLRASAEYEPPPRVFWDDAKYQGEAYGAFSWAVYVAEVTVDTLTGEVQTDDFVALQEVGCVLNPVLAAGQIEGGVAQGIGYALYEKVVWNDGVMANNQMTNYIIPTSQDVPRIRVFFEELPYTHSAMGAKGIGELPMDGPAPAILNAIDNAIGVSFHHIPVLPEDILLHVESQNRVVDESRSNQLAETMS
jgi:CO/xanthine dehydrogenase Mo-binding subunit